MKNTIIGFLIGVCLFLIIGATTECPKILDTPPEELIMRLVGINDSKLGKYQSACRWDFIVDTTNGQIYEWKIAKKTWITLTNKID